MSPEEVLDQHLWGVHKQQLSHHSIKKEIVKAMQAYSNHVLTKKLEEVISEIENEIKDEKLILKDVRTSWLLKTLKEKTI